MRRKFTPMLEKHMSLPNLRDSSFVFPGKLTVISRHGLERKLLEDVIDESGVFIRMGIDIGRYVRRASSIDSKMPSILATTVAVLGISVMSRARSIDGWRMRDLGWAEGENTQDNEGIEQPPGRI